jgi:2-oxoglutarate dehydrogenase E2 component (dihydrolipoamide succinyltransferase)
MPSAARIAEENKLDLGKVAGTGRDGRVTKGDALKAAAVRRGGPRACAGRACGAARNRCA